MVLDVGGWVIVGLDVIVIVILPRRRIDEPFDDAVFVFRFKC